MALLICVVTGLCDVFGPPVVAYVMLRKVEEIPGVYITPQPLKNYSVSTAPGTKLSYFGYSFEVPWTGISKRKESPRNSAQSGLVVLSFASGQTLVFIAPEDQSGLLAEIAHDKDMHNFGPAFGDLVKRSPYDQYSALLNISPSAIRVFGPAGERGRGLAMLMIKAIALPGSLETGAFSFELPGKRGFQLGDPSKSERVQLDVLDLSGHFVEVLCDAGRRDARLTQPELNRILATLRVISPDVDAARDAHANAVRAGSK